ncbi:MAG: Rpn family recombination-promoting nuclease/putative transposase [Desulfitobacterium hafniense]
MLEDKYLLYDLSEYTDEEIKGQVINRIAMTIMKDIQKKDIEGIMKTALKAAMY